MRQVIIDIDALKPFDNETDSAIKKEIGHE